MSVEDGHKHRGGEDSLKDLAEKVMDDKREDGNSEARTRELYDVPTTSPSNLSESQDEASPDVD
jgi:hypothetical protein